MHILYDHQVFSWQRHGGISRYFFELSTRLAQSPGNAVSVFMGLHMNRYGLEHHQDRFRGFYGRQHHLSPRLTKAVRLLNPPMFEGFARRQGHDLYHPTYYDLPSVPRREKVVLTVYDMIHELFPTQFRAQDRTRRLKRRAVERANGIICLSESGKKDLMEVLNVPESKITIIPLANSLQCEVKGPRLVAEPYILFVGNRAGYKNFDRLALAYASHPGLRRDFKLACFGGGAFTPSERASFSQLGITPRVLAMEGPDELLANLYAHASVFVYPSLYEGFGFPPLEAMHYGCPVLVSNTSSIPEVVGEAGLYFDPTDPEDLACQLERLVGDPALRTRQRTLGHQREQQFSWERCAEETQRFYSRVLA